MADYIPDNEGEKLTWLANYQLKLVDHGTPTFGMTLPELTALSNFITAWITAINNVQAKLDDYQAAVEAKNATAAEAEAAIRSWNNKFKAHDNYTNEIGDEMGIKSSPKQKPGEDSKPVLTVKSFKGYVRIKFTKKGFTGVKIFSRLKGQTQWKFVSLDTNSPYDDHTELAVANTPEEREYMAIGMVGDNETGQPSDIVSVVYGG